MKSTVNFSIKGTPLKKIEILQKLTVLNRPFTTFLPSFSSSSSSSFPRGATLNTKEKISHHYLLNNHLPYKQENGIKNSARCYSSEKSEKNTPKVPKVALVLAGCGYLDGSDVIEATSAIINLSKHKIPYAVFSPNQEIENCYNHITKEHDPREERDAVKESARISRGGIRDLKLLQPYDFDAILLIGGYGWTRNISNLEFEKDVMDAEINPDVENVIKSFHASGKMIATTSLAGCSVAQVLGSKNNGPGVAIIAGRDMEEKVKQLGNENEDGMPHQVFVDSNNNVFSVGVFALQANLSADQAFEAVGNLVDSLARHFGEANGEEQEKKE